jgi:hypothetical protein
MNRVADTRRSHGQKKGLPDVKTFKTLYIHFQPIPNPSMGRMSISHSRNCWEDIMKNLQFTEAVDSPQSAAINLGIAMVPDSALAIGLLSGDSSYFPPGDAGTIGGTPAGNV